MTAKLAQSCRNELKPIVTTQHLRYSTILDHLGNRLNHVHSSDLTVHKTKQRLAGLLTYHRRKLQRPTIVRGIELALNILLGILHDVFAAVDSSSAPVDTLATFLHCFTAAVGPLSRHNRWTFSLLTLRPSEQSSACARLTLQRCRVVAKSFSHPRSHRSGGISS